MRKRPVSVHSSQSSSKKRAYSNHEPFNRPFAKSSSAALWLPRPPLHPCHAHEFSLILLISLSASLTCSPSLCASRPRLLPPWCARLVALHLDCYYSNAATRALALSHLRIGTFTLFPPPFPPLPPALSPSVSLSHLMPVAPWRSGGYLRSLPGCAAADLWRWRCCERCLPSRATRGARGGRDERRSGRRPSERERERWREGEVERGREGGREGGRERGRGAEGVGAGGKETEGEGREGERGRRWGGREGREGRKEGNRREEERSRVWSGRRGIFISLYSRFHEKRAFISFSLR